MKLEFKEGDIIKHFKRDMICDEEKEKNMYLYTTYCSNTYTWGKTLHSQKKILP